MMEMMGTKASELAAASNDCGERNGHEMAMGVMLANDLVTH